MREKNIRALKKKVVWKTVRRRRWSWNVKCREAGHLGREEARMIEMEAR